MKVEKSVYKFLDKLIDYAGLFPPANLDLNNSLKNYSNIIKLFKNIFINRFFKWNYFI